MPSDSQEFLLENMLRLRKSVYREGLEQFQAWRSSIERLSFLPGAMNLAFYLALRRHDLRPLQHALKPLGLSTLGRSEAGAIAGLDAVIASLACLAGRQDQIAVRHPRPERFYAGERNLERQARLLFGSRPATRQSRIMVTLDETCVEEYGTVKSLLAAGMNVARINCAHGGQEIWTAMVRNIRRAERETGRSCRVLMELAGAKIRISRLMLMGFPARAEAGDRLLLTKDVAHPPQFRPHQPITALLECTCPQELDLLRPDDPVHIDDGKINGVVEAAYAGQVLVKVENTAKQKPVRLKTGKGLNFPLRAPLGPAVTAKDQQDLNIILPLTDLIGLSWVKTADDISALQAELANRLGERACRLPLVAKIETAEAVSRLPEIIVRAASRQPVALMIARGDLALEVGYERLAELQEEVLWISEAAHVPVIWATQVLENLVKYGAPSRAEITDAAMSERAECVMLNKGPYIVEGVSLLDKVLARMDEHQRKKTSRLGVLDLAEK